MSEKRITFRHPPIISTATSLSSVSMISSPFSITNGVSSASEDRGRRGAAGDHHPLQPRGTHRLTSDGQERQTNGLSLLSIIEKRIHTKVMSALSVYWWDISNSFADLISGVLNQSTASNQRAVVFFPFPQSRIQDILPYKLFVHIV